MLRQRFGITLLAAIVAGMCAGLYQAGVFGMTWDISGWEGGDLTWPLVAARDLVAGLDPYARSYPVGIVGYPLTTVLIAAPFALFPLPLAAGLFIGLSTGLLTWGLIRDGTYWRLWILACYPFWQCVQVANWSILMLAVAYLPILYPILIAKPHIGIPLAITFMTWRRVVLASVLVLLSLLVMPSWPIRWLETIGLYAGRPAILLPFGLVLLLAVIAWREVRARYFLLCCLVPLRGFYDYLLLFFVPESRRTLMLLTTCSWVQFWCWYVWPANNEVWIMLFMFLPCLIDILRRHVQHRTGTGDRA